MTTLLKIAPGLSSDMASAPCNRSLTRITRMFSVLGFELAGIEEILEILDVVELAEYRYHVS